MHYTVDNGNSYDGAPNLDPNTGRLTLPCGQTLDKGTKPGWKKITIHAEEMSEAKRRLTRTHANRPRESTQRRERRRQA